MLKDEFERWAPIPEYEGLYSVSSLGRVRAEARVVRHFSGGPKLLKESMRRPVKTSFGYLEVCLCKENIRKKHAIHRLVLMAFVGAPSGRMDACHNDGCRTNNRLENLRWDTRSGNMADTAKHGTRWCGERHNFAKLSEATVVAFRQDRRTQKAIASEYGLHPSAVSLIKSGKRWAHL